MFLKGFEGGFGVLWGVLEFCGGFWSFEGGFGVLWGIFCLLSAILQGAF